jgi:hypothetical protein
MHARVYAKATTHKISSSVLSLAFLQTSPTLFQQRDPASASTKTMFCNCSDCFTRCSAAGGTPTGSSYPSFRCNIIHVPVEICVKVAKQDKWVIASGQLPDASSVTGSGMLLSYFQKTVVIQDLGFS